MHQNATYQEQSKVFLERAYAELEAGDLHQASEKGWGAATQILKAVAEERGWEHASHRLLIQTWRAVLANDTQSEETASTGSTLPASCTSTSTRAGWDRIFS